MFSPALCTGLAIQPKQLVVIQLQKRDQRFWLRHYAAITLPDSVFNKEIVREWALLENTLTQFVTDRGYRKLCVAISLQDAWMYTTTLSVPHFLNTQAIENEIISHLQMTFSHEEKWHIDFAILNKQTTMQNVFVAAIRLTIVQPYLECCGRSGLTVGVVDSVSFATKRALSVLPDNHDPAFLTAYGLAMRAQPKW